MFQSYSFHFPCLSKYSPPTYPYSFKCFQKSKLKKNNKTTSPQNQENKIKSHITKKVKHQIQPNKSTPRTVQSIICWSTTPQPVVEWLICPTSLCWRKWIFPLPSRYNDSYIVNLTAVARISFIQSFKLFKNITRVNKI